MKTIILPRQAQDKHRENSKKKAFCAGVTWSTPIAIAPHGVSPQSTVMSSGVLAVVYGRPDNCEYAPALRGPALTPCPALPRPASV
jgi:hypothetical protein